MASNTDYGLDFALGEEIDMLRASLHHVMDAEIVPVAAKVDCSDASA